MLGALGQFLFFLWEYLDLLANFFCLFLRFLYPSDLGKAYPTHKKNKSSDKKLGKATALDQKVSHGKTYLREISLSLV